MKQILILFLFVANLSLAQQSIVGKKKIWTVAEGASAGFNGIYFYYLKGDTVLNGVNYLQLNYSSSQSIFTMPFDSLPESTSFLQHYYREDSSRVFRITASSPNECILYDFNLAVGDTFTQACFGNHQVLVTSVDSVMLLDNTYKKRINFDNGNFWIDGIGARDGILMDDVIFNAVDMYSTLSCVFDSAVEVYHNSFFSDCFFITSITGQKEISQVLITPNPNSGMFRLEQVELGSTVALYCITGELVWQQLITSDRAEVSLSSLAKGLYELRVQSPAGTHFQKLMIIE